MARIPENRIKKQISPAPLGVILFLGVWLLNVMSDDPESIWEWDQFGKLFLAAILLILWDAAHWLISLMKKRKRKTQTGGAKSAGERGGARSFPMPDAHCVVCENTGEDHFERDKAQRIAQLDEWLKNGLIDRTEYRVLKDRYEKE